MQVAVLGVGDQKYENAFRWFNDKYENFACRLQFDDRLAHLLYAGGDAQLMPSKVEPCGLAQMIAIRYGTLPIVRETGGLKDSVTPYNQYTGGGTGFSFANYNAHELLFTAKMALSVYYDSPKVWRRLQKQAMAQDFSWNRSAEKYVEIYKQLLSE